MRFKEFLYEAKIKPVTIDADVKKWADKNDVEPEEAKKDYVLTRKEYRRLELVLKREALPSGSIEEHELIISRMGAHSLESHGFKFRGKQFDKEIHEGVEKTLEYLQNHASKALALFKKNGEPPIWRADFAKKLTRSRTYDTNTGYRPTPHDFTNLYQLLLDRSKEHATRSKSLIGSVHLGPVKAFMKNKNRSTLLAVFPNDDVKISSVDHNDIWYAEVDVHDKPLLKALSEKINMSKNIKTITLLQLNRLVVSDGFGDGILNTEKKHFPSMEVLEDKIKEEAFQIWWNVHFGPKNARMAIDEFEEIFKRDNAEPEAWDKAVQHIFSRGGESVVSFKKLNSYVGEKLTAKFKSKLKDFATTLIKELRSLKAHEDIETVTGTIDDISKMKLGETWVQGKVTLVPEHLLSELKNLL